MQWLIQLTGILVVFSCSPLLWGITQTVKARLQGRRGPSIWQMYRIIAKNWGKETTAPEFSSFIFRLAPSVSLAALFAVLVMIPMSGQAPYGWPHDLLTVFFLLALERFWVGLGGLDSAGTFGGLGASRSATIGTGIEPALLAAFGILWRVSGASTIEPLTAWGKAVPGGVFAWALAAASFALIFLAELGRLPVDNPDTHLELTMIHEAVILESSGRLLAMNQMAMTLKLAAVATLGWVILGPHTSSQWSNLGLLLPELIGTSVALGWVESRFTKLRYFQLPAYLSVAAGIGMLGFLLASGGFNL
ncbi:MAG: NADH-quinone oxidoreductase subunit H [Actinomycetota bacterium]|nr:NADH-quinone oxidoreductase subunit H [Actinomycetota bacterium]